MEGFVTGIHQSPLHGFSVEFAEHRPYNQGDNIKNLDWKLLAKTEKKYVKQYIEETNLRCHFWLDVSSSMLFPARTQQKLKFALLAAASMAHLCHRQRDSFKFTLFDEAQILWESDLKSTKSHLYHCIDSLDQWWNAQPSTNSQAPFEFSDLLKGVKRRNMVVVLSDFLFDPKTSQELNFWNALSYLQFQHCEILLVHIQDYEQEKMFEFGNTPIKFIDLESNETLNLHASDFKEDYLKEESIRINNFKEEALKKGLNIFDCEIKEDLNQVLNQFYLSRHRLG